MIENINFELQLNEMSPSKQEFIFFSLLDFHYKKFTQLLYFEW